MNRRARMLCFGELAIEIRDSRTGRVLSLTRQPNLVVTAGKNQIRDLLNGDTVAGLTHLAVGTSSTAVTAADTALGVEVFRAAVTSKSKSSAQLVVKNFLSSGQANGNTLREAGLFNAAAAGTMYARTVLSSAIVKTSSIAVTFTWTLTWS